jgi:iron complex outermembrane receptor protein
MLVVATMLMISGMAMGTTFGTTMGTAAFAQSNGGTLTIFDAMTDEPIVGVAFEYGDQQGSSNLEGVVELRSWVSKEAVSDEQNTSPSLLLSHIRYGTHQFTGDRLQALFDEGEVRLHPKNHSMAGVTVMAVRNSPSDRSVLTPTMEQHLSHDAGEVLTSVNGVSSIRKSGSYGSDPVIRGAMSDQLTITMDQGAQAVAACPNRMDPPTSQIPMNTVSSIEVVKGPYALRYGHSYGGVIRFISDEMPFSETPSWSGRSTIGVESNGFQRQSEGMIAYSSKTLALQLFGSAAGSDSYSNGDGVELPTSYERTSIGTRMALALHNQVELSIAAHHNRAVDTDFASLGMDLISDETTVAQGKLRFYPEDRTQLGHQWFDVSGYYTFVDHLMSNENRGEPKMMDMATAAETQTYGARLEGMSHNATVHLMYGADLHGEAIDGLRTREMLMGPMAGMVMTDSPWQESRRLAGSVFLETRWMNNLDEVRITGRLGFVDSEIEDPSDRFTSLVSELDGGVYLEPGVSLGWIRELDNNLELSLWSGFTTRAPSVIESYINSYPVGVDPYEVLGTPSLDPEKNLQADIILTKNAPRVTWMLNGFVSQQFDVISSRIDPSVMPVSMMSPGVRRMTNIDRARFIGADVMAQGFLGSSMSGSIAASYVWAKDLERDEPMPEIAPFEVNVGIEGYLLGAQVVPSLDVRIVGEQDRVSPEYGEAVTQGFWTADVGVRWLMNSRFTLDVGVHNVMDELYSEHLYRKVSGTQDRLTAPGRSFEAKVSVQF